MPSAATKKGGRCAGFPDVCKVPGTPPVPTPFPNASDPSGTKGAIKKVLIEKKETVVDGTEIPTSKGDEAGTLKGVVSSTHRDMTVYKAYSSKVYAKNKKIVHHQVMTAQNGSNANLPAAVHSTASQGKVDVSR
jgi:hypothetical protein